MTSWPGALKLLNQLGRVAMMCRIAKLSAFLAFFFGTVFSSSALLVARLHSEPRGKQVTGGSSQLKGGDRTSEMDIDVKGADGGPIEVTAVVTLLSRTGQVLNQGKTVSGSVHFGEVATGECTIQVAARGYQSVVKGFDGDTAGVPRIVIYMRLAQNGETGAESVQVLHASKVGKDLGKALEALRFKKPAQARSHLESAYRQAPNHPAVNYLLGVYFLESNDPEKAKSYWTKTLELAPNHVSALLSLSNALIREKKLPEAEMYATRAVTADPSSWRTHAILANILLKEGLTKDAIKEADHAVELGQGQAAVVQPLLALALAEGGNKERAARVLEEYLRDHPDDHSALKQLESLQASEMSAVSEKDPAVAAVESTTAMDFAITVPLPSSWLPSDVDEKVPPVKAGTACVLDEVIRNAEKRVEEFISNVDRFAASEFLKHESISKWGFAVSTETRKFDYAATIEQYRPGYFDVQEYRRSKYSSESFPDGIETRGLSSMALIFHPNNVGNFALSCEGLSLWNGIPTWQVHFRQEPDKPNTMRAYQIGENGPSYPVALRGRAWIAADSYQIVRMETDLVKPLPGIRLLVDHTIVEYGPVRFKDRNVELWLPQSAEMYSDWRGKRMHRRHSFSNYVLFTVVERQRISEPKTEAKSRTPD